MIEWIQNKGAGNMRRVYISIAVCKRGSETNRRHELVIRFSPEAMGDLGMTKDTRFMVGLNVASKQVCIRSTQEKENSFKLRSLPPRSSMLLQARTGLDWHASVDILKTDIQKNDALISIHIPALFSSKVTQHSKPAARSEK